jgi:hypothetical protein
MLVRNVGLTHERWVMAGSNKQREIRKTIRRLSQPLEFHLLGGCLHNDGWGVFGQRSTVVSLVIKDSFGSDRWEQVNVGERSRFHVKGA